MPTRKILVLSSLLAVLGGLALYLLNADRNDGTAPALVFPDLDTGMVRKIAVREAVETVVLVMGEDGWKVGEEGFPADGEEVQRALAGLTRLQEEAVASRSAEKAGLFGLADGEGVRVALGDGGGTSLAEFTVGSRAPDGFSGYLRRQGEERVLLVSTALERTFSRSVTGWREKRVLFADAEAADALTVRLPESTVTVTREDDGTWSSGDRSADTEAVAAYLRRLADMRASDFAGAGEEAGAGFDSPAAEIVLTFGGDTVSILVGSLKDEARQRYVRSDASPYVYLVSRFVADELLKDESAFLAPR